MGFNINRFRRSCCITALVMMIIHLQDAEALGFTTPKSFIRGRSTVVMYGWFDFKPFHGSGSGDSKAFQDEQWQLQQSILRERANKGLTKEELKKKYRNAQATKTDSKSSSETEKGSATSSSIGKTS